MAGPGLSYPWEQCQEGEISEQAKTCREKKAKDKQKCF